MKPGTSHANTLSSPRPAPTDWRRKAPSRSWARAATIGRRTRCLGLTLQAEEGRGARLKERSCRGQALGSCRGSGWRPAAACLGGLALIDTSFFSSDRELCRSQAAACLPTPRPALPLATAPTCRLCTVTACIVQPMTLRKVWVAAAGCPPSDRELGGDVLLCAMKQTEKCSLVAGWK